MACASICTRRLRPTPTACATSNTRSGWPRTATLGDLDRERIADIDLRLSLKLDGSPMAANTANRIRIVARASVQPAIDAGAQQPGARPTE